MTGWSERASEFPEDRAGGGKDMRFPASLAGVPALTEEQRWKALRAVEKQRQINREEYAAMRPILEALGLVDLRVPNPSYARPCSTCGAPVGSRCRAAGGGMGDSVHEARLRNPRPDPTAVKARVRDVTCPTCKAQPGVKCRSTKLVELDEHHKSRRNRYKELNR